jgi:tripartite motif-containing protein 71
MQIIFPYSSQKNQKGSRNNISDLQFYCLLSLVSCFLISCSQTRQIPATDTHPAFHSIGINHILTINGDFSQPSGIAVDTDGGIYLVDAGKSIIYILNKEGKILDYIGRFGWNEGEFDHPTYIALDNRLRLYIADSGNNRIQRFSLIDQTFSVIAGNETEKSLYEPQGVSVDSRGYIYIIDTWNHQILKIDQLGRLLMKIGGLSTLKEPQGIIVDDANNIFVCDTGNNRICKFDFSGTQIAIWGKEGADKGQFRNPMGISYDKHGNIYVVDQGNHRIQVFKPDGEYLTEFGQQYLQNPFDIAVSSDDHVYVTDSSSTNIEVFKIIMDNK